MHLSRSVVGARKGMALQMGVRAVSRGAVVKWTRQVYVRMASTALIFSALQPVRPALQLPLKQQQQQVGLGRVARGNQSSVLLFRQCASTDQGAAGTVLLETRECADGSIMYKFGDPAQANAVGGPKSGAAGGSESGTEGVCDENGERMEAGEASVPGTPNSEPVVVVNGVQHHHSQEELEGTADVSEKLAGLELRDEVATDQPSANGLSPPPGAPVTRQDTPASEKSSDVKDGVGKEGKSVCFNSGASMIPHPEKADRGGEDAFFIEGQQWIGVADGVGGWANEAGDPDGGTTLAIGIPKLRVGNRDSLRQRGGSNVGINAGLYARELMWNCAELARQSETNSDPKTVLVKGFSKTKALGSSTAVVASVANQTLTVANIGDSGFLVIRDGSIIEKSTPMLRGFNFPYQIGSEGDDPLLAEVYRVSVKEGDVIVLASDGLFDNLFQNDILKIVNNSVREGCGPEVVAQKLAKEAHKVGASSDGLTPFGQEAQRVGYHYLGGKMDDITAVVSFIS